MSYKIVSPCSEDWNKMRPVEGGRFCDRCSKKVHDLTRGGPPPKDEDFCGRIRETRSARQGFRRFLWEQKPLQSLLLMLALVLGHNARAQEAKPDTENIDPIRDTNDTCAKRVTVSGTLTDKKTHEPIPFGTVIITNEKHEQLGNATVDFDGKYSITLNNVKGHSINIKAIYPGYTSKEIVKVPLSFLKKEINIKLEPGELPMMGLIIMGYAQPLIDPFGSERVITRDQWNHMAK